MQGFATGPIKGSPELKTSQRSNIFYLLSAIIYVLLLLGIAVDFFLSFSHFDEFLARNRMLVFFLFLLLQFAFSYVTNRKAVSYWRRIEQRRFAAASGDHAWDAIEQPTANPAALGLPVTIPMRTHATQNTWHLARIIVMMVIYFVVLSALCAWSSDILIVISRNRFYDFLFACIFLFLLVALLFLWSRSKVSKPNVIVTEQGAQVGSSLVKWEEARLFAMYKNLNASGTTYELSSVSDIVRWTVFPGSVEKSTEESSHTAPADEPSRQVRALNELVVARTGLPLSDLR
ncbi:hypothetical protein [Dictyobacter aurantiacus]|uniref:Uncharacterized protein n=1 Tax=Dictyobacter aurantiacus TaxID=1936993 RepID=A0A401ZNA3_9CHLR|nr:hypothetical protein [Dictyobacter aurantiacus]GCE08290.1 hypothetical protein KDAU_56190 [Dictyobacter aurantiacus]